MADEKGKKKKTGTGRHKSAIKRNRQNGKTRIHNRHILSTMRTAIKIFRTAVAEKNASAAAAALKEAISVINKTAARGVIPQTRASRYTSRLTLAANQLR